MSFFAGLRPRLMLLAILVALPFMGLTLYSVAERRQHAIDEVQWQALQLTGSAALLQAHLTEEAHVLLDEMAARLRGEEQASCAESFTQLLALNPPYVNLGVADADGDVICSVLSLGGSANVADMPF